MVERAIEVRLFGGLVVLAAGEDVTALLPGRKGRAAVAFLAVRQADGAARDDFVDVLWPEKRPADPRANLRTLLSRIRDAVGAESLEDGRVLRLPPERVRVDLVEAEQHVADANAHRDAGRAAEAVASARAAVDILDRPFLPDIEGPWVDRIRRNVERDVGDMLSCIADMGSMAGGDLGEEAIAAARELVARDGYLERSHALLMMALARRGESAEALRVYEGIRVQLMEELGTSPGPELQALHTAILREEDLGGPAPAAAETWQPQQIPVPPPVAAAAERTFVGRELELADLDQAVAGGTSVITVVGPPGIGKSWLITRAATRAAESGHIVLFGRADADVTVPYQPFVEAVRHLVRKLGPDDVEQVLGRAADDLARIVPELAGDRGQPAPEAPDTERYRLFEAVVAVLRGLADAAPVLVVLDDLHWADQPTQMMLLHVERAVRDLPITFLIAHRSTAADQVEGFADLMAEIRRELDVASITLDGLGKDELLALVAAEVDGTPPDELVEVVSGRTGGNPLLARELTRALVEQREEDDGWPAIEKLQEWPVPDGIQQLVARRLAVFTDDEQALVARAATLGRVVRPAELAVAAAVSTTEALNVLESTTHAALTVVRRSEPGAFAFAHPLIRDAIVAGLSPARLAQVHLENAQRLEQHWTGEELDAHLHELAHHRYAAAAGGLEVQVAVEWAIKAAVQSEHQLAHEASVAHYERALELLADDPTTRSRRARLLIDLAAARWRSGLRDDSLAARKLAFEIASQIDDDEVMAAAAVGHERYFELNRFQPAEDSMVREALARLHDRPGPRRAQLLARLSLVDHWTGDRSLTATVAAEAVRLARESDNNEVLADALNALLLAARAHRHPIHARLKAAEELIELGRELGVAERRLEGEAHRLLALVEGGRTGEIRTAVERFGRIVQGVRQPFWMYFRQAWAATLAFNEGQLEVAAELADQAAATATGARSDAADGRAAATVQRLVEQGQAAEVADLASQFVSEGIHDGVWRSGVAMVLGRAGRVEEAHAVLSELVGPDRVRLRHDVLWSIGACLLADAAHAIRDRHSAQTLYRELEHTPRWIAMAGTGRGFLLVSQRLGQLAQVLGDHPRALAHLAEARRQGQDMQAGLIVAWADLESAATLLDRGAREDVARAEVLLESVEKFAEGKGLGLINQRIAALREGAPEGVAFAV